MVRTLQKKFIFAAMLTVSILLLALVGAINILHCISLYGQQKRMLEMLSEADGDPGSFFFREEEPGALTDMQADPPDGPQAEGKDDRTDDLPQSPGEAGGKEDPSIPEDRRELFPGGLFGRRFSMDDALSKRFFAVWLDEEGEILRLDTSRIYAVTEESAREMAQEILASGKMTGHRSGFRFLLRECRSDGTAVSEAAKILVVMDISADTTEIVSVLGISVLIAALSWIAMLLPVRALSRRAIAPTALSIERQKQFVTDAGHELKTPLAIIQANTEALELYNGENKWTRNIRTQTVRLSGLMQNLLTLSRMDENALRLEKKPFALDMLAAEAWESFAESAGARDITVDFSGVLPFHEPAPDGPEPVLAFADRETIAQLLSILFDNAVKYTPRGGEIKVRLSSESDAVQLEQSNTIVSDEENGGGKDTVAVMDPERLFERFYRTDADRSRKKGGYGIGLSAARAIADANGGTIRARTEGGRIVFTLRLNKPPITS